MDFFSSCKPLFGSTYTLKFPQYVCLFLDLFSLKSIVSCMQHKFNKIFVPFHHILRFFFRPNERFFLRFLGFLMLKLMYIFCQKSSFNKIPIFETDFSKRGRTVKISHRRFMNNCTMMISWSRRCSSCKSSTPTFFFYVKPQKVVEHAQSIVPTEYLILKNTKI